MFFACQFLQLEIQLELDKEREEIPVEKLSHFRMYFLIFLSNNEKY